LDAIFAGAGVMAELCQAPQSGAGFLSGALNFIDCQAQTIGEAGYQAFAQPGSAVSLAITALLTIFVALFGLRLLFGRSPDFGEVIIATIKVGIVLMLATSWAGYRVTVYDLVLKGPAELAATVGASSNLPGSDGGLIQRLQGADDAILLLIDSGSGRTDPTSTRPAEDPTAPPLTRAPIADDLAFGLGRILYLSTIIGGLGLVRLAAGLLLALAPVFAGFLLFDVTRSLFAGWIRMLAALLLAAFAVSMILAVELAALEPWLAQVLSLRTARLITPAAPIELLVIGLAFAVIAFGVIAVAFRLSFAPSLSVLLSVPTRLATQTWLADKTAPVTNERLARTVSSETSRAHAIADVMIATQRREALAGGIVQAGTEQTVMTRTRMPETIRERGAFMPAVPLGQSYKRTNSRVSSAATQRSRRQ
jgi:type IV secretion system protein VirB6